MKQEGRQLVTLCGTRDQFFTLPLLLCTAIHKYHYNFCALVSLRGKQ